MRATTKIRVCVLGLGLIVGCVGACAQNAVTARNPGVDVLIVANKEVRISEISSAHLREIFTGTRSRLDDGTRAIPVVLRGGPAHEVFLRKHIGDTPDEFRTRWRKALFTGEGAMLKEFTSEAALLEYVAATPGTIGYVSRLSDPGSVKVLNISP